MPENGLTNAELVEYLGLPADIIDDIRTAEGSTFVAKTNEFLEALYNKVIYSRVDSMQFSNPFKKYDSYPIKFGDTIENIFVEMPKGYKYDKDATDPFTRKVPSVKALYASINVELQYETTVYDSILRRAALSEYGFMNIIDNILGQLSVAVEVDEYFGTIALLNNEDIYAEGIQELLKGATDTETAGIVCKKIVDTATDFALPKTTNNKTQVRNVAPVSRQLVVIKDKLANQINYDFLVGLFNIDKVGSMPEIIRVDTFKVEDDEGNWVGDDIDFIVIDTNAFDNHVALQDGGMIYNPKGKYTNHFYNLWKLYGFKYFYNARAFKLVDELTAASEPETPTEGEGE